MRRSLPFISALAVTVSTISPSASVAATSNPNFVLTSKLTSCVGKFAAAAGYESYVPGQQQARADAALALRKLLPAIGATDVSVYIDAVNDAKASYEPELVRDPLNTTKNIRSMMEECDAYTAQAVEFRGALDRREAAAEAARAEEQKARLAAEADKRQHQFEQEKLAAEIDKMRAEADRMKVQDEVKAKEFERSKTLAELDNRRAESDSSKARAEADKAQAEADKAVALASAEQARSGVATANVGARGTDAGSGVQNIKASAPTPERSRQSVAAANAKLAEKVDSSGRNACRTGAMMVENWAAVARQAPYQLQSTVISQLEILNKYDYRMEKWTNYTAASLLQPGNENIVGFIESNLWEGTCLAMVAEYINGT